MNQRITPPLFYLVNILLAITSPLKIINSIFHSQVVGPTQGPFPLLRDSEKVLRVDSVSPLTKVSETCIKTFSDSLVILYHDSWVKVKFFLLFFKESLNDGKKTKRENKLTITRPWLVSVHTHDLRT